MASTAQFDIGMIGGGLSSFMGPVHLAAIEKAKCLRLVRGAFGESRQASYDCQKPYGLGPKDVYGAYREFLRHEAKRAKEARVQFVTAVLPHMMHYPVAMTAMDAGIPVLGSKPFTVNLDEATNLARKQKFTGVPYRIAMVYPAYSMLVKARRMIQQGELGILRRFVFSMQSGWMARRLENQGSRQALWRVDFRRAGHGGVVTECACDCQFTLEWLTGLRISEVCVSGRPTVPGRLIPDDATALVRTEQGLAGTFLMSQIATGHHEGLEFEITGDKAAMRWRQSDPGHLRIIDVEGHERVIKDASASGEDSAWDKPYGANDAYIEALSRVYREFYEFLQGRQKKVRAADDRILGITLEEGLRSVVVTDAMIRSMGLPPLEAPQYVNGQLPPPPPPPPKWILVTMPKV